MGRTKNYDAHIANVNHEIANTEKKLLGLQKELDVLIREKETSEATAIYRYVKANHISLKDFSKSFSGILDEPKTNNTRGRKKQSASSKSEGAKKSSSKKSNSTPKKAQTKSDSATDGNKRVSATK